MKWLVTLLWHGPDKALDWYGPDGKIDHGKAFADIVVFVLLVVVAVVAARKLEFPPLGWGVVLIAGAMGTRVFIAFLKSRTVTSTEQLYQGPPLRRPVDDPDADRH
jgi:hypothetical protein